MRAPELAARFDAAKRAIEAIVGAQTEAETQQQTAAKQRLHALLHEGEQALGAGQLHAARAALDAIKPLRLLSGPLPKPTQQRLGKLAQQLGELERWESFGDKNARTQLAERAEALAAMVAEATAAAAPAAGEAPVAADAAPAAAEAEAAADAAAAPVPADVAPDLAAATEADAVPADAGAEAAAGSAAEATDAATADTPTEAAAAPPALAPTRSAPAKAARPIKLDLAKLAREVQALRAEWKALDKQHAGVPRNLWERFDRACEKAYAPAARHFAEQAGQRKQARSKRDEFIAAAAARAQALIQAPDGGHPDWRAIERWLRETDQAWRGGELGSVDPREWKKLDGKLREAMAPARDALNAARTQATATRQALIDEVLPLAERAMERDTVAKVRDAQARWQAAAKAMSIAPRDERALWTKFRAACDAVFQARDEQRKDMEVRRAGGRRLLESICEKVEHLAAAAATDEAGTRRALRDLQQQFKDAQRAERGKPGEFRDVEGRLAAGVRIVEAALGEQSHKRERASWQALVDKERLCEQADRAVRDGKPLDEVARARLAEQWAALPALPPAQEKKLAARRDAAYAAMDDEVAGEKHGWAIEDAEEARAELLLELEMLLGLPTPPELQPQRLALQAKQLRDRFKSGAAAGPQAAGDKLLAWCTQPGVASDKDRARIERVAGRLR